MRKIFKFIKASENGEIVGIQGRRRSRLKLKWETKGLPKRLVLSGFHWGRGGGGVETAE